MKKKRRRDELSLPNGSTFLSIGTLLMTALILYLSSAYQPSWCYNWGSIRPEVRDTVKLIEKNGWVTSSVVGINAMTPQQWHRRLWLRKNASKEELTRLIDYPSGAVKAISYEGLIRKENADNFELLHQALNDTTTFFIYQSGCVGFPLMLGEYLIENVIHLSDRSPNPTSYVMERYNLSSNEIIEIRELYQSRMDKKDLYMRSAHN